MVVFTKVKREIKLPFRTLTDEMCEVGGLQRVFLFWIIDEHGCVRSAFQRIVLRYLSCWQIHGNLDDAI